MTLFLSGCRQSGLPQPGSKTYADLCSAFYLGLAGLQSGEDVRAKEYLTRSTTIAPGEPASWADLGILQVRQQQFDAAYRSVDQARALVPQETRIEALLGLIEDRRGKLPEAATHLKRAISLDGHNVKALYSLAQQTERDPATGSPAAAQALLKQILAQQPQNRAVLLDDMRLAAKRGDANEARSALGALQPLTTDWPEPAKRQLGLVQGALGGPNVKAAAVPVQFLRNVLLRVPTYRQDLETIQTPATLVARPFTRFLRLPSPSSEPAPPDTDTRFASGGAPFSSGPGKALWTGAMYLDDAGRATLAWADERSLHLQSGAELQLPTGRAAVELPGNSVVAADLNYDFKADVAIATEAGLRIYRQLDPQHFRDITAEDKVPANLASAAYDGVWAFDIDLDGDLDLVLGVRQGKPVVLRNNGDDTFTAETPFDGLDGLAGFAAADLDGDGDPDVALLDPQGGLHVYLNERLGAYRTKTIPASVAQGSKFVQTADIDGDGSVDVVLLRTDGSVQRLSPKPDSEQWDLATLCSTKSAASTLLLADVDNNGALDIVAGRQVFLSDGTRFQALTAAPSSDVRDLADTNGDGLLDAVTLGADGRGTVLSNSGQKKYHWQAIRTRAAHATGDQRMNSFGIGGEIEIRSELLAQKQIIQTPVLHFGLGTHTSVQFARMVWPNGFVQAEFDLGANQAILAEQRIKGSCPMLFTWNGQRMEFQKDVGPWGSALGLNVNAQGKGIYGTREWFNIKDKHLQAHDGFYDLRITAEYWETYYMDHYSLLAVDHPIGSEVYTDERFALPSPTPNLIATTGTKPFAHACDQHGADMTDTVHDLDQQFVGTFSLGQYQGLAEDHYVELQLPADAPVSGPLYLVGQGWIHDTDATIVKAQAQNSKAHPEGMSIQVPDASGRWVTVREGLGFPKGRTKTIILDISNLFLPQGAHKLRLRTNLELYWDKLAWASGLGKPDSVHVTHLDLASADLRFRGFSLITKARRDSPELPHYDDVRQGDGRWRDQEGYVTRYGPVRDLLTQVDDRYVITSPGDELRMRFPVPPPPAPGYQRDFVLICDGWVKDADYNSTFSATVLPLPYHAMKDYVQPPTTLETDHAYQLHPQDWDVYQTRYVGPQLFSSALWNRP